MNQGIWKSDWFVGLIISLAFLVLSFIGTSFIQSVERSAYDFGVSNSNNDPSDKIAIIAIDDQSIANIGRWPWSRDIHAAMHEILAEGGAKAIGQTTFFVEPQLDKGLELLQELQAAFAESNIAAIPEDLAALNKVIANSKKIVKKSKVGKKAIKKIESHLANSPLTTGVPDDLAIFDEYLLQAITSLNTDFILAESMAIANNVILPMQPFEGEGKPVGNPDYELPEYITNNRIPVENITKDDANDDEKNNPLYMVEVLPPIPMIGELSAGVGTLLYRTDVDGAIRTEPLVIDYYGDIYPSMAMLLAAKSLNLGVEDIKVNMKDNVVELGSLKIKTNGIMAMNTFFYNAGEYGDAFAVDSFFQVMIGDIPVEKYQGKIVLIGATAFGLGNSMVTPVQADMAPVLILAHSVSSILKEHFFVEPGWGWMATYAAFLLVALYLMVLLPRLGAASGFVFTTILIIAMFMTNYMAMTTSSMWIQLMLPVLLLGTGHLLLTTKRFLVTEKGKERLDIESAESNRMLGLSMQGQGQLDMAFEKFRKLPMEKPVLELMYNLALDYERKRQFNKAKSVYDYMSDHDAKFRDISDRANRAQALEETVILGGAGGGGSAGATLLTEGGIEKPMLGRYEIEKELGKGAMGSVYLGKDPKISRVVAIKTMALSQEFEEDELEEVKERFFREAETAGRLTHPNIVTIYDAGDEHDLAYIAMEFLKGSDLVKFCKKDTLLPLDKVLDIIQQSADGLAFAHEQNVVHRDIKPANIMYDPESDTMKITDFGIARITDSSKTKTGMVLGTPSYMSPEQLAGKKVSGQSDLFSLGVMLYQMVTGVLPFTGDSMATLMYKIANEEHPPPESVNPALPRCVTTIINRSMEKDVEKRYKTGKEMASDIIKCRQIIEKEKKV